MWLPYGGVTRGALSLRGRERLTLVPNSNPYHCQMLVSLGIRGIGKNC